MSLKSAILGLMIVLASSMMTACIGTPQETGSVLEEEESSSTEPQSVNRTNGSMPFGGEDGPMPLDHPIPIIDFRTLRPPAPPDLDLFFEPWERNPKSRGCTFSYVVIYDPAKGKKIELPVTLCP